MAFALLVPALSLAEAPATVRTAPREIMQSGPPPERNILRLVRHDAMAELRINGELMRTAPVGSDEPLVIDGTGRDDTLVVDFRQGNPIPRGGLTFHGLGHVTKAGDALWLEGGSAETEIHSYRSPTDGTIEIDGSTIVFTGLEPVVTNIPATNLIVNATNAANSITVSDSTVFPQGLQVAVDGFEVVDFINKTNLTINGLGGSDEFSLDNSGPQGGLISVNVFGGSGDDSFAVTSPYPVSSLFLHGELGDDYARVVPTNSSLIRFFGGTELRTDYLVINEKTASGPAIHFGASILVPGFVPVEIDNVERVGAVDADGSVRRLEAP